MTKINNIFKNINIISVLFILHPGIIMFYFLGLLVLTFIFNHPVFIVSNAILVLIQSVLVIGIKKTFEGKKCYVFLGIGIVLLNILFNHRGAKILFYLFHKPVSFESIAYGFYTAILIITMISIFNILNNVLGTGKILYLFSRYFPQTNFILNLTLRWTDILREQGEEYLGVQKLKREDIGKNKLELIVCRVNILQGFLKGVLEEGMSITEILKSKNYGKKNRTTYQNISVFIEDIIFLIFSIVLLFTMVFFSNKGIGKVDYYSNLTILLKMKKEYIVFLIYILYLTLPLLADWIYLIKRKWTILRY